MKTVFIARHGESVANVTNDRQHHDPELSYLGTIQCRTLREHVRAHAPLAQHIELIVASPMRRTLQTAIYAFSWLVSAGVPVVARAEWQEMTDYPCDTGTSLDALAAEFPSVDFSMVDPLFPSKMGPYAYNKDAVLQRGRDAKSWLRDRPERVIAVVSHATFLRTSVVHAQFANADYRIFDLCASSPEPELIEWDTSAKPGGAMGRSPQGTAGLRPGDFKSRRSERRSVAHTEEDGPQASTSSRDTS